MGNVTLTTPIKGYFVIPRLTLNTAYRYIELGRLWLCSHFKDMIGPKIFYGYVT